VIAEGLDGLGRRFEYLGDHLGPAAAGVDGAGEDDHAVLGRVRVVVAQPVLDRGEGVLDGGPGLFGLDVRGLGVFLGDVADDGADLPVFGDVDGDELRSGPLVLL